MGGIIGNGVDIIVEVGRIARMLEERGGRFLSRCFTSEEQSYADGRERRRAEQYAQRFEARRLKSPMK